MQRRKSKTTHNTGGFITFIINSTDVSAEFLVFVFGVEEYHSMKFGRYLPRIKSGFLIFIFTVGQLKLRPYFLSRHSYLSTKQYGVSSNKEK